MNINDFLTHDLMNKFQIKEWGYTEDPQPINIENYNNWIQEKKHLPLNYLAGDRQKVREDIRNYYPEFKSALVFLFSYHEAKLALDDVYANHPEFNNKIASYTIGFEGFDYHIYLKEKLIGLLAELKKTIPDLEGVLTLDVHPVLERDLAVRVGLGWQGKNSMFITRKSGSFFIIGSILLNKELELKKQKQLETDHCGQCTRCIEACPTGAIEIDTRTIIAKDCISTFTIEEFKIDTVPSKKMDLKSGYIFGCDICQNVCPWNLRIEKYLKRNLDYKFTSKQIELIDFFLGRSIVKIKDDLELMSNNFFSKKFQNTSFLRSGKRGVLKNLIFYLRDN